MKLTRLHETLEAAGIPIDGVSGAEGNVRVDYRDDATTSQRNQGAQIVASFDWSDLADTTWLRSQQRKESQAAVDTAKDPAIMFERAALIEVVVAFNGLVDYLDAQTNLTNKPTLRALKRTRAQWIAAIKARLDAGDGD